MQLDTPPVLQQETAPSFADLVRADARIQRSAGWFWWIAGLSLLNTVVNHVGGNFHFVIGLAVTEISDALFGGFPLIGYAMDVLALGFFVGMGCFARKGHLWAFVVGALFYLVDGGLYAYFSDWLPAAFHAYALYCIYLGFTRLRELSPAKDGGLRAPS